MDKQYDQFSLDSSKGDSDAIKAIINEIESYDDDLSFKNITQFYDRFENLTKRSGVSIFNSKDFDLESRPISSGNFADLYKAKVKESNYEVAVKKLKQFEVILENWDRFIDKSPKIVLKLLMNELLSLRLVDDERIMKFYGIYREENDQISMVFSLIDGITLKSYIHENVIKPKKDLPLKTSLEIIIQISEILVSIHSKKVIHRDLKPENLIINPKTKNVYLIDFGLAKIAVRDETQTVKGTFRYCPPEAFYDVGNEKKAEFKINTTFDVWSLGLIIIELITGKEPLEKLKTDHSVISYLKQYDSTEKQYDYPVDFLSKYKTNFYEICQRCFDSDPSNRSSSEDILTLLNEWLENFDDPDFKISPLEKDI